MTDQMVGQGREADPVAANGDRGTWGTPGRHPRPGKEADSVRT